MIAHRSLLGSDATILAVSVMHLSEAAILVSTTRANAVLPLEALLGVFLFAPLAAAVLLLASAGGLIGQWVVGLNHRMRFALMVPQLTLLLITGFWAITYALHGNQQPMQYYPPIFVLCNQFPRILMPVLYAVALMAALERRFVVDG